MGKQDDPTDHSGDVIQQGGKGGWLDRQTPFESEIGWGINSLELGSGWLIQALMWFWEQIEKICRIYAEIEAKRSNPEFFKSAVNDSKFKDAKAGVKEMEDKVQQREEMLSKARSQQGKQQKLHDELYKDKVIPLESKRQELESKLKEAERKAQETEKKLVEKTAQLEKLESEPRRFTH